MNIKIPNFNIPDHPVYHPEKTVANHIAIVTLRAFLLTGNFDLVFAGLFHDWFKPQGQLKSIPEGDYISNPLHAKQAYEWIMNNDDVKYFIKQHGGNYINVANIVLHHMDGKITNKNKHIPYLDIFFLLDNMLIDPRELPSRPTYNIYFVGQSPIQRFYNSKYFTITYGTSPKVHPFSDIPKIFRSFGYVEIGDILQKILQS